MGDIVDRMFESGMMDYPDPFDYDDQSDWYIPRPKTCKYCGKKGLSWKQTENGWRLAEKGKIHTCLSTVT